MVHGITSGNASRPNGGGNSRSPHCCLHMYSAHWSILAARSKMYTFPPVTTVHNIHTNQNIPLHVYKLHKWIITVTHTHTHNRLTTFVRDYPGRPEPEKTLTHSHPTWPSDILYHLPPFTASSLFILCAWQSSRTTSVQVLFGLPLGLGPSTSYSIHFFTQSSSSFRSTCPYQCSLFCCKTYAMSSIPSLIKVTV